MKKPLPVLTILKSVLMLILLAFMPSVAMGKCNVCHSKNPKMVRMHEALEFKGCFQCHGSGRLKPPPEQRRQMMTDPICVRCHR